MHSGSGPASQLRLGLPFAQMTPFNEGAGSRQHRARVAGLSADPNVANTVYVRCAANPDFVLRLQYGVILRRAMPVVPAPRFQRTNVGSGRVLLSVTNLTPGLTNELLQTTNLSSGAWQTHTTFQSLGVVSEVSDPLATNQERSFYRLRVR